MLLPFTLITIKLSKDDVLCAPIQTPFLVFSKFVYVDHYGLRFDSHRLKTKILSSIFIRFVRLTCLSSRIIYLIKRIINMIDKIESFLIKLA
jgi:hypothetical protein